MAKRIRHVSNLPEWFDLARYAGAESLDTAGWYEQLSVRRDLTDWVRFGVLPYLDLQIWQQEAGVKIPNRVMADAIFPPGEGGEEVVRKTTAKLADELLTMKHLTTLAALAAHEIAERNSA